MLYMELFIFYVVTFFVLCIIVTVIAISKNSKQKIIENCFEKLDYQNVYNRCNTSNFWIDPILS